MDKLQGNMGRIVELNLTNWKLSTSNWSFLLYCRKIDHWPFYMKIYILIKLIKNVHQLFLCWEWWSKPSFFWQNIFNKPICAFLFTLFFKAGGELSSRFLFTPRFLKGFFLVRESMKTIHTDDDITAFILKIPIEQNRCAMACQGCGAVLFLLKKQWNYFS